MIRVAKLGKTFGKLIAVDDVSLTAERGKIFGLLGPNGAGKTSVLRMIYGVLRPTAGKVEVDGLNVENNTLKVQRRLGALPDGGSLYKRLSARENIQYFGALQGMNDKRIAQSIAQLSALLGMEEIIDRRTAGFSQGERMKVSLARALVHDPDYVLLDEPTNGLDVLTTRAVRELLLSLKSRGKCVIFSSHLMHEVANLCDEVGIIAHGKVTALGSIERVIALAGARSLEDAFVHFAYREPRHRATGNTETIRESS